MTPVYFGIDPGKKGAVAVLDPGGDVLGLYPMPMIDTTMGKGRPQYDVPRLFSRMIRQGTGKVLIERLGPMPASMGGAAANYQRGYAMGMLQAICTALKLPWDLVSPSVWQRVFWKTKGDTKQQSILTAERLFPQADLLPTERSKKPNDGMSDALLIAEYNRRYSLGLLT